MRIWENGSTWRKEPGSWKPSTFVISSLSCLQKKKINKACQRVIWCPYSVLLLWCWKRSWIWWWCQGWRFQCLPDYCDLTMLTMRKLTWQLWRSLCCFCSRSLRKGEGGQARQGLLSCPPWWWSWCRWGWGWSWWGRGYSSLLLSCAFSPLHLVPLQGQKSKHLEYQLKKPNKILVIKPWKEKLKPDQSQITTPVHSPLDVNFNVNL